MLSYLIILFSGANSPHTHPRATEIQIVVQGGPVYTEFIMENGASPVKNIVPIGSATIFPKGSIHFQQNLGKFYSLDLNAESYLKDHFRLRTDYLHRKLRRR